MRIKFDLFKVTSRILSDNSRVYDVTNRFVNNEGFRSSTEFNCVDQDHASRLAGLLNQCVDFSVGRCND